MEERTVQARTARVPLNVVLWLRLARVFQKVDQLASEHLRQFGISVAQFDLLMQVGRSEGLTQQDLAKALLVTKGNICQLVDRMEDAEVGLIRRIQVGRSNQIVLTDKGRALKDGVMPAHEAYIDELFSSLANSEQTQLATSLRKLERALSAHIEKEHAK